MKIADILKIDGRKKAPAPDMIFPLNSSPLGKPSVSIVKMTINSFKKESKTTHSGFRQLLPYVMAYCEENKISYKLQAGFKDGKCYGYYIEKVESL